MSSEFPPAALPAREASPRRWRPVRIAAVVVAYGVIAAAAALGTHQLHGWLRPAPASAQDRSSEPMAPARPAAGPLVLVDAPPDAASSTPAATRGEWLDDRLLRRFQARGAAMTAPATELPREQRWRMHFPEGLTEGPYARQLDGAGIELGVLLGDGQIEYASSVSEDKPQRRTGTAADEPRFYMTWARGDLVKADRSLLAKAGIKADGKIVLHFYTPEAEKKLLELELAHAQRAATEVELTRFGIKRGLRNFEFYVVEQVARP